MFLTTYIKVNHTDEVLDTDITISTGFHNVIHSQVLTFSLFTN